MKPVDVDRLLSMLAEARELLSRPGNDYAWSSWRDAQEALRGIERLAASIKGGSVPRLDLQVIFSPTGPMQEVGLSSGWGEAFLDLASRFDEAMGDDP
jgi:hypothetical protein